ncbi:phage terminase, small subunit, P27 family [Burkholderia thailandensis]|nr:phage terminase, small subunit, P27 family [Burkholderia thailandensis]
MVTNIEPPDWIVGEARDMWERVVPLLCGQKILQVTDLHIVEIFCAAYGNWRTAQDDLTRNGPVVDSSQGSPMKNPAATVVKEAAAQMASFGAMLGSTRRAGSAWSAQSRKHPTTLSRSCSANDWKTWRRISRA